MSDHHVALPGVQPQSGLAAEEQRDLLLQLVQDLDSRVGRFPDAPREKIARAAGLLFLVYLPQFGPLNFSQPQGQREGIARGKARDLVSPELLHNSFRSDWQRPVGGIYDALIEVITTMAKNAFPLSAPPRWVAELFSILGDIVKLKLESQNLSITPPTNLDVECQTYVALVLGNLGNGGIRASRQWNNFRSNDVEVALDSKGNK